MNIFPLKISEVAASSINIIYSKIVPTKSNNSKCKAKTFHGDLYGEIIEGKDLPNLDASFYNRRGDLSDPYVSIYTAINGTPTCRVAKTRVIDNDLNPHWGEKFSIVLCHKLNSIIFSVMDEDMIKYDDKIGNITISAEELAVGKEIKGWFPLDGPRKNNGMILLSVRFVATTFNGNSYEVPNVIFPMRTGCSVRLYQDAHTPALPPITDIKDRFGQHYNPPQCWIELSAALEKAQKLIYIIGWSIKVDISLLRTGDDDEELGNLLKRKANEGVKVLILIWDEALSNDMYPPGMMGTHDEMTYNYFKSSKVKVLKAPRAKKKGKLFDQLFVFTTFTHHQKCVIVDAEIEGDKRRKLIAFQGGIDLTDGRWDTFDHPLYTSLFFEHRRDFYNGICKTNANMGPRQPWHDVHMLVEGKAVKDILTNFVERWRKLAPDCENLLVRLTYQEFDLDWQYNDCNNWNVQYFRSINSDSVMFDNDALQYLKSRKGRNYDDSIQQAYIHNIRRAKNFIYIENQYFLGSSHSWKVPIIKCSHLIPIEITLRIKKAIFKREQFRVYIVVPLHPEGDPTSAPVQEILHWQFRTIEMMYKKIGKAILKANLTNVHPTDYLSFFCLGKRENIACVPANLSSTFNNSIAAKMRNSLRLMIYVHSKMAIFDDEYIILGSANINERSMNGNRDTEMAFGVYQPNVQQEGDVRSFRLALWAEHIGTHMQEHLFPSSLECMKTMRRIGRSNLSNYFKPVQMDTDSHLMTYPLKIEADGCLHDYPDFKFFPDTSGLVVGKSSILIPNSLTT